AHVARGEVALRHPRPAALPARDERVVAQARVRGDDGPAADAELRGEAPFRREPDSGGNRPALDRRAQRVRETALERAGGLVPAPEEVSESGRLYGWRGRHLSPIRSNRILNMGPCGPNFKEWIELWRDWTI